MDEIRLYREYLKQQDRSPLTIKGYESDLNHFSEWFTTTNGEACTLAAITPSDVRAYRQSMLNVDHYKAATVNRRLAAVGSFMAWAVSQKHIEMDPTHDVRHVPQVPHGAKYLNKKEQFSLQRAIEKDIQLSKLRYPVRWRTRIRDASIVTFLLHTGLRIQEALSLHLDDVQMSDRKGTVIVRQGKGGKQRSIPLNADARKALAEWLDIRPKVDNRYLWIPIESDGETGSLCSRSVQRITQRLGQDAGLTRLTPHVLRHTFGKNLIDAGVGIEKVAALMGHSNLNTTRIYVVPNESDLEQAVEGLSRR